MVILAQLSKEQEDGDTTVLTLYSNGKATMHKQVARTTIMEGHIPESLMFNAAKVQIYVNRLVEVGYTLLSIDLTPLQVH